MTDNLYGRKWRKLRQAFLKTNPLCNYCLEQDKVVAATVVDHITPHKGNIELFYDCNNLQSLCKAHHDKDKQLEELGKYSTECGRDGMPVSPNHPWNSNAA